MLKVMNKCLKQKLPMKIYKFYLLLVLSFFPVLHLKQYAHWLIVGCKVVISAHSDSTGTAADNQEPAETVDGLKWCVSRGKVAYFSKKNDFFCICVRHRRTGKAGHA